MINLLSSFAEFERELIRDRLAESRAALKRQGRRVAARVPYGYITDQATKQLASLRSEARRVKALFERAAKGEKPRQIADHANRHGWRMKVVVSRNLLPLLLGKTMASKDGILGVKVQSALSQFEVQKWK